MRYRVNIEFEVETAEFNGVEDTNESVRLLVLAMVAGQADFPDLSTTPPNELRVNVHRMDVTI